MLHRLRAALITTDAPFVEQQTFITFQPVSRAETLIAAPAILLEKAYFHLCPGLKLLWWILY